LDVLDRVAQIKIFDNALRIKESRSALEVGYADKAAVQVTYSNGGFVRIVPVQ